MGTSDDSDDDTHTRSPDSSQQLIQGSQSSPIAIGSSPPQSPRTPTASPTPPDHSGKRHKVLHSTDGELEDADEVETQEYVSDEGSYVDEQDDGVDGTNMDDPLSNIYAYVARSSSPFYESQDGSDSGQSGVVRLDQLAPPTPGWGSEEEAEGQQGRWQASSHMNMLEEADEGQDGSRVSEQLSGVGSPPYDKEMVFDLEEDVEEDVENNTEEDIGQPTAPSVAAVEMADTDDETNTDDAVSPSSRVEVETVPSTLDDTAVRENEPLASDPVEREHHSSSPPHVKTKLAPKTMRSETAVESFRLAPRPPEGLPSPFYIRTIQMEIQRINGHTIYSDALDREQFSELTGSTIGNVRWESLEKEKFFDSLAAVGKDAIPEISRRVGTKSELECSDYLRLLQDGADQRLDHERYRPGQDPVMPWEIPMAFEIPEDLETALDWEAERLRKHIEEREDGRLTKLWGEHAIIDEDIADFLDKCMDDEDEESLEMVAPEAALLNVGQMLSLSKWFFMNGPGEWNFRSVDPCAEPSIYYTAVRTLHKLVVGITRRLVVGSMLQAETRRDQRRIMPPPTVLQSDILAAAQSLGLPPSGREYWISVARRNNLRVVQTTHEINYQNPRALTYEQVEGFLSRIDEYKTHQEFGQDMDAYEAAKRDEDAAFKRAHLSLKLPSPPTFDPGEGDEDELSHGTDYDESDFICPSSPEPHGPLSREPATATQVLLKRDRLRFTETIEHAVHRIDEHLNARSTVWHWRRFFRQSRPIISPPALPHIRRLLITIRKRLFSSPSNWRKSAHRQALRSNTHSRKPNPSEAARVRKSGAGEEPPKPWGWRPKSNRDMPSWLPTWKTHRDAGFKPPEPVGKKWMYSTGRWVDLSFRRDAQSVARRRQRKQDLWRRKKLGNPGELVEPSFAPPVTAFPLVDWKKYTARSQLHPTQTENMVLKAWRNRPKPVLWGSKYEMEEWDSEREKNDVDRSEEGAKERMSSKRDNRKRKKIAADISPDIGGADEFRNEEEKEYDGPISKLSSSRHKKRKTAAIASSTHSGPPPPQLHSPVNSPEASILAKALSRSPPPPHEAKQSSTTSKFTEKGKKRKQSPVNPTTTTSPRQPPKRRRDDKVMAIRGVKQTKHTQKKSLRTAKLVESEVEAVTIRSPRKKRIRRQSSMLPGFVSIVNADLEGSNDEEEFGGGGVENSMEVEGNEGEGLMVDELVSDSTESEYEE